MDVLYNLGYKAKPNADFHMARRNLHFFCAARSDAAQHMDDDVREVIGPLLPAYSRCVRVSRRPPTATSQADLPLKRDMWTSLRVNSNATDRVQSHITTVDRNFCFHSLQFSSTRNSNTVAMGLCRGAQSSSWLL